MINVDPNLIKVGTKFAVTKEFYDDKGNWSKAKLLCEITELHYRNDNSCYCFNVLEQIPPKVFGMAVARGGSVLESGIKRWLMVEY